jgi:hypothetical protein
VAAEIGQLGEKSRVPFLLLWTGPETKIRIPITHEFTALVTGHGKTKSYLHRFNLIDNSMCPCNEGQQTSEHIIFRCNILEAQRNSLIKWYLVEGPGPQTMTNW